MSLGLTAAGGGDDGLIPSQRLLMRLEKFKKTGEGRWMACCPAHQDKTPSLSIQNAEDGKLLIHCFAGCEPSDVVAAVGLEFKDLWPHDPTWTPQRKTNGSAPRLDVKDAQFTLEIAKLTTEAGDELTELGRTQCTAAIAVLLDAGIKPMWMPAVPEAPEPEPLPLPPTLSEYQAFDFPVPEQILGPFATSQLSLLYAPPGIGKTMLGLSVAYAVAENKNFAHWRSYRAAKCLYVDGEMVAGMLQHRLKGLQSENLRIANLVGWGTDQKLEPLNLATEVGAAILIDWIERTGTTFVVLDNLMSLAWVEGVSMNSDEFWQPVRRLLMLLRSMGVSCLVIDHANAGGQVFGTKVKLWHVDLALRMTKINEDEDEEMAVFDGKIAVGKMRFKLAFDKVRNPTDADGKNTDDTVLTLGNVGESWEFEDAEGVSRSQAIRMKENGLTIMDIANELGASKSAVGRWVKGIKAHGK